MSDRHACPHSPTPSIGAVMLTINGVAAMLACSPRTVHRLVDAGRIPRPVHLGGMIRWPREPLEQWIARRCPSPTEPKSRPGQAARNP